MQKVEVLEAFIAHFKTALAQSVESAKVAHEAATHEESRAEDRHDTFAIESSYLAHGQAKRASELVLALQEFERYLANQAPVNTAKPGTLILLEEEGDEKPSWTFLAQNGGGTMIQVQGKKVLLVTLRSPMGEALEGLSVGDSFEVETKSELRAYSILNLC